MRKGIMSLSQESIGFQSGNLYKELTVTVDALRDVGDKLTNKAYFESKEVEAILKTIKLFTGITFKMKDGESTGPAMMPPRLDSSHIFIDNDMKEMTQAADGFFDVHAVMKSMEKKTISGTVDLKNSKVEGAFEKLSIDLYMPRTAFQKDGPYSSAEIAAVILHEVGHAFTFMEFLSRSVTTNQVLAGMVRAADKSTPSDKREMIFAKGSDLLRMSRDQKEAIVNSKSQKEVAVIVLDAAMKLSVSELGVSLYDVNSCEYLADQFAARHGAGRELVTALDKFMRSGKWRKSSASDYILLVCNFILISAGVVYLTVITLGTFWVACFFIGVLLTDKSGAIYDNEKSRFLRIKHQNIERLKDTEISVEEKRALIESNDTIDTISKFYDDNLKFIQKVAYYLRPSYRNAHKYELLQKDLEKLASSDLFTHAAKFSTL